MEYDWKELARAWPRGATAEGAAIGVATMFRLLLIRLEDKGVLTAEEAEGVARDAAELHQQAEVAVAESRHGHAEVSHFLRWFVARL